MNRIGNGFQEIWMMYGMIKVRGEEGIHREEEMERH